MSTLAELVDAMETRDWEHTTVPTEIAGYTEERFSSPREKYEIEIRPQTDEDRSSDEEPHPGAIHFFVNVFEYTLEDGRRVEMHGPVFSRRVELAGQAVSLAEDKLAEYDEREPALWQRVLSVCWRRLRDRIDTLLQ